MAGGQDVITNVVMGSGGAGGGGPEYETIVNRLKGGDVEARYVAFSSIVSARSADEINPVEQEPVRVKLIQLVEEGDTAVLDRMRARQGGAGEYDAVRVDAAKALVRLWPETEPGTVGSALLAGLADSQDKVRRGNVVTAVKELAAAAAQRPEDAELQSIRNLLKADEVVKEKLLQVVKEADKENVRLAAVLALIHLGWGENVDGALLIGLNSPADREKVVRVAYEIQKSGLSLKQIQAIHWDRQVEQVVKELAGFVPDLKVDKTALAASFENAINFLLKLNELTWPLGSSTTPIDVYWADKPQKNQATATAVDNLWYYLQELCADKTVPATFKTIVLLSAPQKDAFAKLGQHLGEFSAEMQATLGWEMLNDSQMVTAVSDVFPAAQQITPADGRAPASVQESELDEKELAAEIVARKTIVQLVDAVLTNKKELVSLRLRRQQRAAFWLAARQVDIYDMAPELFEIIHRHLKEIEAEETERPESKAPFEMARITFDLTWDGHELNRLFEKIARNEGNVPDYIARYVAKARLGDMRRLVRLWEQWIALDDKTLRIETAEMAIRHNRYAVLPLVERVKGSLERSDLKIEKYPDNQKLFYQLVASPEYHDLIFRKREGEKSLRARLGSDPLWNKEEKQQLQIWLAAREDKSSEYPGWAQRVRAADLSEEEMKKLLDLEITWIIRQRKKIVNRRIASLLATMSDPWYLEGDDSEKANGFLAIQLELRRHVVPYFAQQLNKDEDLEIRENMARMLANLADRKEGQMAIDALVQAVIGEERRQNRRQDLLSEYYLEPSRQRSEEAAHILNQAVEQAKATLITLRRVNLMVIVVGLTLVIVGFGVAIFSETSNTRLMGLLAGMGGLAGVIRQLIKDPLDRIQNAMANLVQMEAAFTTMMWELNLNQTFIQSRYVANGHLTFDEIQTTVDRVEKAMQTTMQLVETYTETSSPRLVTRLTNISPVAAEVKREGSSEVTIYGQYLQGDGSNKKEKAGILALNHVPIGAKVSKWEDDKVVFHLRQEDMQVIANGRVPDSVLVSLIVDGMETNSLPLRVIHTGRQEANPLPPT
ncbi:MAG: hypothetical protein KF770_28475 [Anaerolineae bacterium]|nr:hypothetical protein [Anaerolineae bacterium]